MSPLGVKTGKAQNEQCFPVCPRKRTPGLLRTVLSAWAGGLRGGEEIASTGVWLNFLRPVNPTPSLRTCSAAASPIERARRHRTSPRHASSGVAGLCPASTRRRHSSKHRGRAGNGDAATTGNVGTNEFGAKHYPFSVLACSTYAACHVSSMRLWLLTMRPNAFEQFALQYFFAGGQGMRTGAGHMQGNISIGSRHVL
jgi:hypothetical protein